MRDIYPGRGKIRIALVQMRCEKGAIAENIKSMAVYLDEAEKRGLDIIGFPEANITGFNDPPKSPEGMISLDGSEVSNLLKITEGRQSTVLAGLIEENPAGKPFITHIVVRDGKLLGYHHKIHFVDIDESWSTPGTEIRVFDHNGLTFGIAICSEISDEHIFAEYARQGAEIVFELAAPGLYGEQATRDWRAGYEWWEGECLKYLPGYAKKYGIWIAVATQAGRTVDEDFPGGGYVFAPDGNRVYATTDWSPGAVYLELDLDTGGVMEL